MATSIEKYLILCETLKKMEFEDNYIPTDYEHKVVTLLLEQEKRQLSKSSKSMKRLNEYEA